MWYLSDRGCTWRILWTAKLQVRHIRSHSFKAKYASHGSTGDHTLPCYCCIDKLRFVTVSYCGKCNFKNSVAKTLVWSAPVYGCSVVPAREFIFLVSFFFLKKFTGTNKTFWTKTFAIDIKSKLDGIDSLLFGAGKGRRACNYASAIWISASKKSSRNADWRRWP